MAAKVRLSGPIPSVLETAQLMGLSVEQVRRLEELLEGNGSKLQVRKVADIARRRSKLTPKTNK
jgi:hypothetical protein